MRVMSEIRRYFRAWDGRFWQSRSLLALLAAIALLPDAAAAQQQSTVPSKPNDRICRVYAVDGASGAPKEGCGAVCNGRGVLSRSSVRF